MRTLAALLIVIFASTARAESEPSISPSIDLTPRWNNEPHGERLLLSDALRRRTIGIGITLLGMAASLFGTIGVAAGSSAGLDENGILGLRGPKVARPCSRVPSARRAGIA